VFLNIIVINHKIIKNIKNETISFFKTYKKEQNIEIKRTLLLLKGEALNNNISITNNEIKIVSILGIIGNTIFYFYLSKLFFITCFILIGILVFSFSSIKANQIKFENKIREEEGEIN
jgi:hypothetical protein